MEQYISKSALVAEIERRISCFKNERNTLVKASDNNLSLGARIAMCEELIVFIDTLEVKEVDLEKEIEQYVSDKGLRDYGFLIPSIAQHFFKLGLNASNPLTFEDIRTIDRILDGMRNENQVFGFPEGFYNEALKRFKAQKVEKV